MTSALSGFYLRLHKWVGFLFCLLSDVVPCLLPFRPLLPAKHIISEIGESSRKIRRKSFAQLLHDDRARERTQPVRHSMGRLLHREVMLLKIIQECSSSFEDVSTAVVMA